MARAPGRTGRIVLSRVRAAVATNSACDGWRRPRASPPAAAGRARSGRAGGGRRPAPGRGGGRSPPRRRPGARCEPYRQGQQVPGHERAAPAQLTLGHAQLEVGQPTEKYFDAGVGDGPADVLAGTLVGAAAEGEVRPVAVHGRVGIGPDLRIGVARRQAEQQHVAGLDVTPPELGVPGGPPPDDGVDRRVVPQDLFERVGQRHVTAGEAGAETPVGQDRTQGVRDEVGGRLVRRDQHDAQVHEHLRVGEVRRMLQQPGGQVTGGHRLAGVDQLFQGRGDVPVALQGRLGPLQHVAGRLDQAGAVLVGCADELGHDEHGELVGEGGDQVGASVGRDPVDQLVGEAGDVAADASSVEAQQGLHDGSAQPLVDGSVGEVAHRYPRDHGAQRGVGRHPALPHVAPARGSRANREGVRATSRFSRCPRTSQARSSPWTRTGATGPCSARSFSYRPAGSDAASGPSSRCSPPGAAAACAGHPGGGVGLVLTVPPWLLPGSAGSA